MHSLNQASQWPSPQSLGEHLLEHHSISAEQDVPGTVVVVDMTELVETVVARDEVVCMDVVKTEVRIEEEGIVELLREVVVTMLVGT